MSRILVIDDQQMVRQMLRSALEHVGHEVWEAGDGLQGMRALQSQQIDLVITDIVMPEKEGLECVMDIRRLYAGLPVIAISGGMSSCALDVLDLAKRLGAHRTLEKPFSMASLLRAVQEELQPRPVG